MTFPHGIMNINMFTSTIIGSIGRMFEGLSAGTTLGKIGIAIGTILTAFYSPILPLLLTCFAFSITDMIYGIKIAIKNK